MKKFAFAAVISVLLSALTLAAFEGVYSLYKWRKPHRSVVYQLSALVGFSKPRSNESAYAPYFSNPQELADLLPLINETDIGIGHTPFPRNEDAAIKTKDNGCPTLKPNLRTTTFFLHASAFGPYAFPTAFYKVDEKLDPRVEEFFRRYGGPHIAISTNSQGERVTVPDVAADRVVLVAGDSVAFGAMIDDEVTIASQMQARDGTRRYVNLGVPGNSAEENHCRLEAATQRYKGRIDELIYVYCENDLQPEDPYGSPPEVIEALKSIVAREKIGKVTVVFAPSIYMVVPEMTRVEDSEWTPSQRREKQRAELKELVEAAGFRWADAGVLARSEEQAAKSVWATLAYFTDTVHLSAYGTRKLVDQLMGPD
ncbi:SGNH/GDSL hydrolase family protein [Taklimakanibacter deserti]|uniref:SGNH/GDSL hydrolase family protein n=1 Tax=Taklimakanibacter deserti TaxID=2267839 RepID=UPI0013C47573